MSKIKVNEIESSSTNVKLAAKGSGVVKVKGAGGSDGTLQLNSGTHSVKIKSPAHSAQQSYTMILPDNNIETGKFLKVKSVTGSGNTATGQLEYATISEPDRANLNASAVTSGTLPSARFTPIAATVSALKLISAQTVGATAVSEIEFTGLQADKKYLLIGKRLISSSSNANSVQFEPWFNTNYVLSAGVEQRAPSSGNVAQWSRNNGNYQIYIAPSQGAQTWHKTMGFMVEINNAASRGSFFIRGMWCGNSAYANYNLYEGYHGTYYDDYYMTRLKIKPYSGSYTFTQDSVALLYQYGDT